MSLQAFRSTFVIVLAIVISFFQPAAATEKEENQIASNLLQDETCVREELKVLVPKIRGAPVHDDLEYPAWQVNYLPESDLTQLGGPESFDHYHEVIPGNRQFEITSVSDVRFESGAKGWKELSGGEWLAERGQIAQSPEYMNRSEGFVTRPVSARGEPLRDDNVDSTYILTWGEYTAADISKPEHEIINNLNIRLPEEKTLQKAIHRYTPPKGKKGIGGELRAVSIRLGKGPNGEIVKLTPPIVRDEGLFKLIQKVLALAKEHPESYEEPWVTFYADKPHREIYENWLKVSLQTETTPEFRPAHVINKKGEPQLDIDWWYMQVSPKTLEEVLMKRAKGRGRMLSDLNLPHEFELPNGKDAIGIKNAPIAFDSDGNVTLATLRDKTELLPKIFAAPKSTAFWVDQNLVRISAIAEEHTLKHGSFEAVAPAGSTLEWDSPYLKAWVSSHPENVFYRPNVGDFAKPYMSSPEEWQNELRQMRRTAEYHASQVVTPTRQSDPKFVREMNHQARIFRKKAWETPALTRITANASEPIRIKGLNYEVSQLEISGDTYVLRMAKDTALYEGMVAAKGTDLELEKVGEHFQVNRVCLANDFVVRGKHYKKGTVLMQINGKIMELTQELSDHVPYSH